MSVAVRTRRVLNPLGALTMAVNRSARYITSLSTFMTLIDDAVRKSLTSETVQLFQQQGRVFDRVVIRRSPRAEPETLFHIRVADGFVFGPKSNAAPNTRLWFGTIYTSREWDFSDPKSPKPKNPDRFKKVGQWGPYTHWIPKNMRKSLADRKSPLPTE